MEKGVSLKPQSSGIKKLFHARELFMAKNVLDVSRKFKSFAGIAENDLIYCLLSGNMCSYKLFLIRGNRS